jgi:hypothetical protein
MYIFINFFTDLSIHYDMATSMINEAHSRGLVVHPWEIRAEPDQVYIYIYILALYIFLYGHVCINLYIFKYMNICVHLFIFLYIY